MMTNSVSTIAVTGLDTHDVAAMSEHGVTGCLVLRLMGTDPYSSTRTACLAVIHPVVAREFLNQLIRAMEARFPDAVAECLATLHRTADPTNASDRVPEEEEQA